MPVSQNGYSANDRSAIAAYTVSDSGRVMNLRKGSPGELLAHFIRWFDRNIRDIDPGIMDDWSYAERPIRGGTELSNHASGTAADVDATKWPLGVEPSTYLTADEIRRVREQLKVYQGCIRWGGDYTGRKDPMHFEIDEGQATCDRVWAQLLKGDDLQADERQALMDIRAWLRGGDPNVDNVTLLWMQNNRQLELLVELRAALLGNNPAGRNNFHWIAEQIAAAVASIPGAQVDQEALRAAIAASVSFTKEELADAAADEVAARLND